MPLTTRWRRASRRVIARLRRGRARDPEPQDVPAIAWLIGAIDLAQIEREETAAELHLEGAVAALEGADVELEGAAAEDPGTTWHRV